MRRVTGGIRACVAGRMQTSIRQVRDDPLPGDRRRAAPAGGGGRVRRRAAAAERGRAVGTRTRPAGSRSAGRSRRCATRAWSTPARASAGSWPPTRCASARPARHDRGPAGGRGARSRAADPRLRLRARRRPRCRQVLGVDTVLEVAPAQPGRRRAVRPRHGVVPRGARRRAVAGRRRAVAVLRAARRRRWAAPPRRIGAARRRPPTTPSCSGCPRARPCCAASGSPVDVDGRPVLVSEHVFPAHRTEFVVDLPTAERSIAPSGLRLVDEG